MEYKKFLKIQALILLTVLIVSLVVGNTPSDSPNTYIQGNPLYDDNDAYCLGDFTDPDSNKANVTVNWSVSSTQVYGEKFLNVDNNSQINSTLERTNYTRNQEVLCNVTVNDQEDDNVVWDTENVITDTFPPEISGPVFHNYTSEHEFNVSAVLLDRESDDEIRKCWLNATDENGNKVTREMELRRYYGDANQARCFYSSIGNFLPTFDVLEDVSVTIYANDSGGDRTNRSDKNTIPNSKPRIYDVRPTNDATISSDSVELKARVEDQDGEDMGVKFIDETDSRSTQIYSGVSPGTEKSTTWNNLKQLKTYYWRLNVTDGYQTTSELYRFRNQFPTQFRPDTRFETPYSSVLVSPNTSRIVRYTVQNSASSSKSGLVTKSYGADSVFPSTGLDTSDPYDLSPGESRTFNIEISPDREGKEKLVVATSSDNYNINTSDSIEIYVSDRPGAVADVPGIGIIQILFLMMFSTLFYSARL